MTSFETINTGTMALNALTLSNSGYIVNVQGGVNHIINATANTGADDTFVFDNNVPQDLWAGTAVTIQNFMDQGNDILDLGLLGIQFYREEVAFGSVDTVLTGGTIQAVFDLTNARLIVDIDKDGFFNASNDLQILMAGVDDLTAATDLLF